MVSLQAALTPQIMQPILALQGSSLGFKTDKDSVGGYDLDTVRNCTIEAWLRGFNHVGNEFNIIAGRFYGAKAGFERLVKTHPGLMNLEVAKGNPEIVGQVAYVTARAVWKLDSKSDEMEFSRRKLPSGQEIDLRVPVRVNSGMGIDAILGKADRKIYAAIYARISGETIPDGDAGDVIDTRASEPKVRKSDLFSSEPFDTADAIDQGDVTAGYLGRIADAAGKQDVATIAKEAGGDRRLSAESRKTIMADCSRRQSELARAGK
jgi:hypothetical protein